MIIVWYYLCLTWGSLRSDDGLHVDPSSLRLTDISMIGYAYQTKTQGKDKKIVRVRHFAVIKAGHTKASWLQVGWDLFWESDACACVSIRLRTSVYVFLLLLPLFDFPPPHIFPSCLLHGLPRTRIPW